MDLRNILAGLKGGPETGTEQGQDGGWGRGEAWGVVICLASTSNRVFQLTKCLSREGSSWGTEGPQRPGKGKGRLSVGGTVRQDMASRGGGAQRIANLVEGVEDPIRTKVY